jgi:hypothetical protein
VSPFFFCCAGGQSHSFFFSACVSITVVSPLSLLSLCLRCEWWRVRGAGGEGEGQVERERQRKTGGALRDGLVERGLARAPPSPLEGKQKESAFLKCATPTPSRRPSTVRTPFSTEEGAREVLFFAWSFLFCFGRT